MDSLESGFLAEAGQERAAPTRQKSCNACVRGKRRCDKRTPRCSRCAAKGLDCVYQRMPPHDHSRRPAGENAAARAAPASSDGGTPGVAAEVPEFDMAFDMADALGSDTSPDSLRTDASLLDAKTGPLEPSLFDLLTPPMSGGSDDWNLLGYHSDMDKMYPPYLPFDPSAAEAYPVSFQNQQPPQQQQQHQQHQQQPRQQQQQLPVRDLSLLKAHKATCLEVDPLHVHDPRTRLGFIVAFLSSMPDTLASTRTLPCMHPRLWAGQLPKPILSAFSAATAYRARSPQTRAWTVKLVADASRDIQREGERAATSAVDKLARVQALFVVNLMRFFDGDIGLRAAAEREAPILLAWTKDLIGLREELEEEAMTQKGPSRDMPPKSWDSWIFLESVRRSIMSSYAFMCIFCLLRSEEPDCEMWTKPPGFTASKHLWDAASSVEFYRAWREKPQYWIENLGFKDFWMYGRAADLDDFTRLILTSHVGVDAMDHFMEGDVAIPV